MVFLFWKLPVLKTLYFVCKSKLVLDAIELERGIFINGICE